MTDDLTWEQWEIKYQHELNEHPANYELLFVRQCIKPIGIQPKHVIPQYHFVDSNGKNRYIDFVIIIREGVYLPIEIDGLSKMIDYDNTHEQRYERFNDFLFRQNEIINRFGTILRYSNKYWLSNPNKVADEILLNIRRVYFHNKPKEIIKENIKEKVVYKEIIKEVEMDFSKGSTIDFSMLPWFLWTLIVFTSLIGFTEVHYFMHHRLKVRKQRLKEERRLENERLRNHKERFRL